MAIIVLTAGHGGKDPGAVNGSTTEAERMTTLRNATKQALQDLGEAARDKYPHIGAINQS